jgi:hypothetical protein
MHSAASITLISGGKNVCRTIYDGINDLIALALGP